VLPSSPRRRVALAGLVLVVAVVVVLGAVVVRGREDPASAVPQDRPGVVLLLPGYGGGTAALEQLATVLRASGREVVVVPTRGDGTGDLREHARALDAAARAAVAAGAPSVDVVGYSAGGVVARLWVAELGGDALARRVVTLGSPHHGTGSAELAAVLAPQACPAACQQLVPDGDLLGGLEDTPPGPLWTSIWTDRDEVVTPPDSAVLDGAVNVELQAVCADAVTAHGQLPTDPLAVALLQRAIGVEPLAAAPGPSDCADLRSGLR